MTRKNDGLDPNFILLITILIVINIYHQGAKSRMEANTAMIIEKCGGK